MNFIEIDLVISNLSNYDNRNTEYNKPLYESMRKHGIENFVIEEIE